MADRAGVGVKRHADCGARWSDHKGTTCPVDEARPFHREEARDWEDGREADRNDADWEYELPDAPSPVMAGLWDPVG